MKYYFFAEHKTSGSTNLFIHTNLLNQIDPVEMSYDFIQLDYSALNSLWGHASEDFPAYRRNAINQSCVPFVAKVLDLIIEDFMPVDVLTSTENYTIISWKLKKY